MGEGVKGHEHRDARRDRFDAMPPIGRRVEEIPGMQLDPILCRLGDLWVLLTFYDVTTEPSVEGDARAVRIRIDARTWIE